MALDGLETGIPQHRLGGLPALHRAEAGAALPERDRRAMGTGHRVEKCGHGKIPIVFQMGRPADILHQIDPAGAQRPVQPTQQVLRVFLVVNRIERRDDVVAFGV